MNDMTPECELALELLQRKLDGEFAPESPQVQQHLAVCPECHERFAAAEVFLLAFPPKPPTGFADRMTTVVRRDQRQRTTRQWLMASAALAACLMLALRLSWSPAPQGTPEIAHAPSIEKGRLAQARTTMLAWTDTAKHSLSLPTDWAPTVSAPDDLTNALEPATTSLAQVGTGVSSGLEPITGSAKRAVSMFRREVPATE